jgi:hypothetical protein
MNAETQLDQLKKFTKVVADSGDFATLKEFAPQRRHDQSVADFQGRADAGISIHRGQGHRRQ